MRFCWWVLCGSLGCSFPVSSSEIADASAETAEADSDPPDAPDAAAETSAAPETSLVGCAADLPADFACAPPAPKVGKSVCTDAMIDAFLSCFTGGDVDKCTEARTSYPECSSCFSSWLYLGEFVDTAACIHLVDPSSPCAEAVRCNDDCLAAVCGDCDRTPGSGAKEPHSERDDCRHASALPESSANPKGVCYDVASKTAKACETGALTSCFAHTLDAVVVFYRGACRDGGDWSAAGSPK